MNVQGFLTAGEPVYQSGRAAQTSLADPPYRPEIYTHEFHGAHSRRQVVGALTLKIEVEETAVSAGDEIGLSVFVDNSRTGHKMPSGSAELRFLWLELRAYAPGNLAMRAIPIPVSSDLEGKDRYGVFGGSKIDRGDSKDDLTEGSRIYRSIQQEIRSGTDHTVSNNSSTGLESAGFGFIGRHPKHRGRAIGNL